MIEENILENFWSSSNGIKSLETVLGWWVQTLRLQKRKVRRPELTLAVPDHNVPTTDRSKGINDEDSRIQDETLRKNCKDFGV